MLVSQISCYRNGDRLLTKLINIKTNPAIKYIMNSKIDSGNKYIILKGNSGLSIFFFKIDINLR